MNTVDTPDLRPRTTVALFDAAVRLVTTGSGIWAFTLPAGAALVASAFNLTEAVQRSANLVWPSLWVALAWSFRAISQGAACFWFEQQLVKGTEPSIRQSWLEALKHAPGLLIAAGHNLVLNLALGIFTLGLGFLFVGAHSVAYAVIMRGEGSALSIYSTCSKLLGPSRHKAAWVRSTGLVQIIIALNLHGGVAMMMMVASQLLGFDVTFAERFTSLDNAVWASIVIALTFSLCEPIRAATATLLLIDGRVRSEGLDLVAAIDHLPRRKRSAPLVVSALAVLLCASPAFAETRLDRLSEAASSCQVPLSSAQQDDLAKLPERESGALTRFVETVETLAYDDEDCDAAAATLKEGLAQIHETRVAWESQSAENAQSSAQSILAQPEFQNAEPSEQPAEDKPEEAPGWFKKLWDDFWEAILKALKNWKPDPPAARATPDRSSTFSTPDFAADLVVILAIALVVGILGFILWRSRERKPVTPEVGDAGIQMSQLPSDPMSALARPAETWAGLADELARAGQFREAIRHLYLALLSRLHGAGAIDYDPTRSNWDYLKQFKGVVDHKRRFRELTLRFDFAWYGNLEVHQVAWAAFRALAEPMLTSSPPGAPGA